MKPFLLVAALAASASPLAGQSQEADVMTVVNRMFDGMHAGDSAMVRSTFHQTMTTASIFVNRQGEPVIRTGMPDEFVKAVGTPHDKDWDERIWDPTIHIDGRMATAWTPYAFYLGGDLSHCGVNAFQLFDDKDGWKIIRITDTRRRKGCEDSAD
jgi:hypothetical protein